jgi:hypothetical protein
MPTTFQRFQITETPSVANAIDAAAAIWPTESRARLILRLIEAGGQALRNEAENPIEARRRAIRAVSGTLDDVYGPGYLSALRADWAD